MIGKILASGQLGKLASFVTPAFFDVMPAKALWGRARALLGATRDREAFRHAVASRAGDLAQALPSIELASGPNSAPRASSTPMPPDTRAAHVVELYFRQLFHGSPTLLDLRGSAFSPAGERLIWRPAPWVATFADDFILPLREVYRGFYAADDAAFRAGLNALSLAPCEDLFRKHFGAGVERVTFRTVDFIDTFHQVFERCKQTGNVLHPDFLPLGVYLAALYDHLEDLAVAVDVASAFQRATLGSRPDPEALHA